MSKKYKQSYRVYSAWNYEKEIDDLNAASEQGWQLVKGGCFHSKFVKNPDIRYRYQLDYRKIEDMGRYIETFREQGWEYINSTFNGWHYFRKIYDPMLPEEAYEILTDRESLHEMNHRWARLALIIGAVIGVLAVICAVRVISKPNLPLLVQLLSLVIESAILIRGWLIMKNPKSSHNRRGDSAFLAAFFAVIILCSAASITLTSLRPRFFTEQRATAIEQPILDNRWVDFDVYYPDYYYLDLTLDAPAPMTFEIVNENGESVYEVTEKNFHGEAIRLRLPKGRYWFSMTCDTGFQLSCSID